MYNYDTVHNLRQFWPERRRMHRSTPIIIFIAIYTLYIYKLHMQCWRKSTQRERKKECRMNIHGINRNARLAEACCINFYKLLIERKSASNKL